MANNREKIFKKAIELIPKHHLFFIEDVISFLPITKATFYDYYKVDSDELNAIKELLDIEKVNMKVKLRAKMYNSKTDTATLALYKLICSDEERKKLAMTYNEVDNHVSINWTENKTYETKHKTDDSN